VAAQFLSAALFHALDHKIITDTVPCAACPIKHGLEMSQMDIVLEC